MKQCFRNSIWIVVVTLTVPLVHSQQPDKPVPEQSEMLIARILVLDPDGHPLDGATVTQQGLLSNAAPNSLFSWRIDDFGPLPIVVTNAEGIAEFPYPKIVSETEETDGLRLVVEHPEFVPFFSFFSSIREDPIQIKLERGFRIAANVVHAETGQAIKSDLFALTGSRKFECWKLHDNGMLVSPVYKNTETLLRVMRLAKGQPTLFSKLITIKPDGTSRVLLKDLKLFPGTRVEGRLADGVTRPINNGYVIADVIHLPESGEPFDQWTWSEDTPIADDGTFVFESLPSDAVAQLVPICDDWVPAKPTLDSVLKFFPQDFDRMKKGYRLPQLLALKGGTTNAVLEMVPATSARVTVLDPEGKPLANADVWMHPGRNWFQTDSSSILGLSVDVRDLLLAPEPSKYDPWAGFSRFRAKTDGDGVVVIRNLPVNCRERVDVFHDKYQLPETDRFLTYTVRLKPGEIAEITIQMQNKGTEVLGAEKDEKADNGAEQDDGN